MLLSYIVSDFEKINFKGITKFCKRLNYNVKATVKMDSNGVHITILDEDKNVGINIVGVHDNVREKESVDVEHQDDNETEFTSILNKCKHSFFIEVLTENEIRLCYLLAMYISSDMDLILMNMTAGNKYMTHVDFKDLEVKQLETWVLRYGINNEFLPQISSWQRTLSKTFKITPLMWTCLIVVSFLASILLYLMLIVYSITNGWLIASPFIVIGSSIVCWIIYNLVVWVNAKKEIRRLNYEYEYKLCELYEERLPKKPSIIKTSAKQFIIDLLGVLILPTIIFGSILIALEHVAVGALIITFPWIGLVGINLLWTDNAVMKLQERLYGWLYEVSDCLVDEKIMVLNFQLSELEKNKWQIELLGCNRFDETNSMWTRKEAQSIGCSTFKFDYSSSWEEVEEICGRTLKSYLDCGTKKEIYRQYKAIVMGFEDGIVYTLYVNENIEQD